MSGATLGGVWIVAQQEFRIRLRTGRWRWLLAGWVAVLALFTALLDLSLSSGYGFESSQRGAPVFGLLMLFVLGMVLVISPALTSQAVNGDRERGTLATLQVTGLKPMEIALGKLGAGWGVGLTALALTLPFTGYAMLRGGVDVFRIVAVYAVVALLIGVVCAISLSLSAMLARTITSTLLAYLVVAALSVGTVIAFAIALPLVAETRALRFPDGTEGVYTAGRQDLVWWIIAPNPFVVVADAAPTVPPRAPQNGTDYYVDDQDMLSVIGRGVRDMRRPPLPPFGPDDSDTSNLPVWPYGLAFDVALGVGAVAITARRLRTPTRKLPPATRIA